MCKITETKVVLVVLACTEFARTSAFFFVLWLRMKCLTSQLHSTAAMLVGELTATTQRANDGADEVKKNIYKNELKWWHKDLHTVIPFFFSLETTSPSQITRNKKECNREGWQWWCAKFSHAQLVFTKVYATSLSYKIVKAATVVYRVLSM